MMIDDGARCGSIASYQLVCGCRCFFNATRTKAKFQLWEGFFCYVTAKKYRNDARSSPHQRPIMNYICICFRIEYSHTEVTVITRWVVSRVLPLASCCRCGLSKLSSPLNKNDYDPLYHIVGFQYSLFLFQSCTQACLAPVVDDQRTRE
jgi:hypothetical protein